MLTPVLRLRESVAADDGMTIVEVIVTCLMTGLIALTLVGLDAAGRTTADQRARSQAYGVAAADQERIKGLSGDQIFTLDQTRTVTLDNVPYEVTSKGQFLSQSADSASCSSSGAAADYAKVESSVDWVANKGVPVLVQSVVTPRAGGSLLAKVLNQDAAAVSGVKIDVAGAQPNNSAVRRFGTTDAEGCTIFSVLPVGDYTATPALAGYVDKDGNASPAQSLTTTAGNTSTAQFTLGQAGRATAGFSTTIGSTTIPNQLAPSLSWFNAGMATPGVTTPGSPASSITTPQTLFPFMVSTPGNYANNYTVWAGSCAAAKPPLTANQRNVTVGPGLTGSATGTSAVRLPAMLVDVTYGGTRVRPAHVELTDSCGQTWQPEVLSTYASTTGGWLRFPGQPYGTYSICADYQFQGTSTTNPGNFRKFTISNRANTNFTAQNSNAVAISNTTPTTSGFC